MSENIYFKNYTRNEYICASGNGNRVDSLRYDNPEFITWVLVHTWTNAYVACLGEYSLADYGIILESQDVTKSLRKEFEAREND